MKSLVRCCIAGSYSSPRKATLSRHPGTANETPVTPSGYVVHGASPSYIEIQITLITTSRPLFSPPSYLKLHMPSVFSFQYAPVALCMPRRPTCGFPSVPVAPFFASLVVIVAPSASVLGAELSRAALALLREEVGTRCWMMVLFTAYLNEGVPPVGEDSDIRDRRIEFWAIGVSRKATDSDQGSPNDDGGIPRLRLRMLVELRASQRTLAGLFWSSAPSELPTRPSNTYIVRDLPESGV